MLLDWFTIGAQALNFLILVWLLKHFLYKPILNAVDAREWRLDEFFSSGGPCENDGRSFSSTSEIQGPGASSRHRQYLRLRTERR